MKKETNVAILIIMISLFIGIFFSIIPNTNAVYVLIQRIGHSLIFAGIFITLKEFTFVIRKKSHAQTISELFSLENKKKEKDLIVFGDYLIIKENNKLTFQIDLLRQYLKLLAAVLIVCASLYIILPTIIKKELLFLSEGLEIWMIILICLFIFISFLFILPIFLQIYSIINYNVINIIDPDRKTFITINKKRTLSIPFSNLKELEVRNYENTTQYFLVVPIKNYNGDISIIKQHRMDEAIILLPDKKKKDEFLQELKENMSSFLINFIPNSQKNPQSNP
ncbi:hypothetical protein DSAG12_02683 [Promethearchaeum syntrophicum]|uniref:Uncharacterized protein n=1 Tax=Promethearchaeum syntrophicum TaxID=2594042 RepID=A0A5B9DDL5_9ARCH|nr:hypothetical protein [Candidatus Prometheoarchaeum syntrophicum]QEE16853.1 hypothetical protein DSAG12_02683 [Candidatus Prometheoarchaeum syntrophicum]